MGSGGGGSSTTVQKADPWVEAQPYLKNVLKSGEQLFQSGVLRQPDTVGTSNTPNQVLSNPLFFGLLPWWGTPSQQNSGTPLTSTTSGGLIPVPWYAQQMATLPNSLSSALSNSIYQSVNDAGAYGQLGLNALMPSLLPQNASYLDVGQISQAPSISQYGVNEAPAVANTLYGGVSNPFIAGMASDLVNRTGQAWTDQLRDTQRVLQDQVLPGVESQFNSAGQLGQSRHALFAGKAVGEAQDALGRYGRDLATNLSGQLANLGGGLYESAANRSASLASQLAGQRAQTGQANASLLMQSLLANQQAQQANQQAQLDAQKLNTQNNMLSQNAIGMLPMVAGLPTSLVSQQLSAYNPLLAQEQGLMDLARANYYSLAQAPWDYLTNYASKIVYPASGMGSTTVGSQPSYSNPISGALGGMMAAGSMIDGGLAFGLTNPWSWPLLAGGAILGGMF